MDSGNTLYRQTVKGILLLRFKRSTDFMQTRKFHAIIFVCLYSVQQYVAEWLLDIFNGRFFFCLLWDRKYKTEENLSIQ